MVAHPKATWPDATACRHHRFTTEEAHYIAEASCWFVKEEIEFYPDTVRQSLRRDKQTEEVANALQVLQIDDPIAWGF